MLNETMRELREEKGMSLSQLARKSGHAVSTIFGIENNSNKNPSFFTMGDVAEVLGVSLDGLYKKCNKRR